MKTLRVALTTVGALVALVGGAETATWGLSPLSASNTAGAPQIGESESGTVYEDVNLRGDKSANQSSAAEPQREQTPIAYEAPPEPPTNADADGPRYVDGIVAGAIAPAESPSTATAGADEEMAATAPSPAGELSVNRLGPDSESPSGGALLGVVGPD